MIIFGLKFSSDVTVLFSALDGGGKDFHRDEERRRRQSPLDDAASTYLRQVSQISLWSVHAFILKS